MKAGRLAWRLARTVVFFWMAVWIWLRFAEAARRVDDAVLRGGLHWLAALGVVAGTARCWMARRTRPRRETAHHVPRTRPPGVTRRPPPRAVRVAKRAPRPLRRFRWDEDRSGDGGKAHKEGLPRRCGTGKEQA